MTGRVSGRPRTIPASTAETIRNGRDHHDYHLAFLRADLIAALLKDPRIVAPRDRDAFLRLNRLLGAILHAECVARIETLRDLYHAVDPDILARAGGHRDAIAERYEAFMDALVPLLRRANFIEVPGEEIERAHTEAAVLRLKVSTPLEDFHAVRFFRRGRGLDAFDVKRWFGLGTRKADVEVYRAVVMIAAVKAAQDLDKDQRERLLKLNVQPGSIVVKCVRDIASADMNVLLPNLRIDMSVWDKLTMAIPAVVGGVPIILKLVSSLTVLFVVIGFYLGIRGAVRDEEMKTAIAALGALVALGAFFIRQWVRYERLSLKYLKELTDKVFARTINQNAGFFDYILGATEDQERKEALLAYAFLRTGNEPQAPSDLRIEIENWLKHRFGYAMRFEVLDALDKLVRLGLVSRTADGYRALPLEQTVTRLTRVWQEFFAASDTAEGTIARPIG